MKTQIKQIKKWLASLFRGRVIDANKIHQLKEKGITPLFIFADEIKFCKRGLNPSPYF